jgi:N-acetylglucosaminyl-diphospho-decaprenol L-rhamnosyltransferase
MNDVCVVIVSHNGKRWLPAALTSLLERAGDVDVDVVVVDNGSDGSAEFVERSFPAVRTLRCENRGFGHANNLALATADARYVLFLNPDTEFLAGQLGDLVEALDRRPEVGLAGTRQVDSGGTLAPSIRRFPSVPNMLAEALGIERVPGLRRLLGERELDLSLYGRETPCDWTSGSFMLARSEALAVTGGFDERFFLFSEETDLCWRIRAAGWEIEHLPGVTIRHYEHAGDASPRLEAQAAYARMQFAEKHLERPLGYRLALGLRYGVRFCLGLLRGSEGRGRREAAAAAFGAVVSGRAPFAGQLPG